MKKKNTEHISFSWNLLCNRSEKVPFPTVVAVDFPLEEIKRRKPPCFPKDFYQNCGDEH